MLSTWIYHASHVPNILHCKYQLSFVHRTLTESSFPEGIFLVLLQAMPNLESFRVTKVYKSNEEDLSKTSMRIAAENPLLKHFTIRLTCDSWFSSMRGRVKHQGTYEITPSSACSSAVRIDLPYNRTRPSIRSRSSSPMNMAEGHHGERLLRPLRATTSSPNLKRRPRPHLGVTATRSRYPGYPRASGRRARATSPTRDVSAGTPLALEFALELFFRARAAALVIPGQRRVDHWCDGSGGGGVAALVDFRPCRRLRRRTVL